MKFAYLYLTFNCNSNCLFCASDKTNIPFAGNLKKEISFLEAINFMDNAVQNGIDSILISGGEPTTHKHIIPIIEEASKRFKMVNLASNGIRFSNKDFAKKIVGAGLNGIGVPFYSRTPSVFNELVQHKGAFKRIVLGLHNLFALKTSNNLHIRIKILVMKPNYRENSDTVEFIKQEFPAPDGITFAGLRVGKKAFSRKDDFFIPYNIARPFTSEAIRRVLPYRISFDFLPLCALDTQLVRVLLKKGVIPNNKKTHFLERPDYNRLIKGSEPFHYEDSCLNCNVFSQCSKVHKKNAEFLDYESQLESIRL